MSAAMIDGVGWAATALFVSSYFFSRPMALRAAQMLGALFWLIYGVLIGARPVIGANALVMAAAAVTTIRALRAKTTSA